MFLQTFFTSPVSSSSDSMQYQVIGIPYTQDFTVVSKKIPSMSSAMREHISSHRPIHVLASGGGGGDHNYYVCNYYC